MSKKENKNNTEKFVIDSIKYYHHEKKSKEACEASFDEIKRDFYVTMERYFDKFANDDGKIEVDVSGEISTQFSKLVLSRVQKSEVLWDIPKLKKVVVDDKHRELVFSKEFNVVDWPGFIEFLKESGIKFKDFKKFINISESVREKQLDKLIDLGLIDNDKAKKCCDVKLKPPYYTIREK